MSRSITFVALYLDAPLQSWGYESRFDRRTTLSYPTRSGVLGMLCAALGIDRADDAGLSRLSELGMKTYCLKQPIRMTDFHTVGGGYDKADHPRNIPRRAGTGKPGGTVISRREYLQDARFGVVLDGRDSLIAEIAMALQSPRWGLWLGRKACVPASPVFQGTYPDATSALGRLKEVSGCASIFRTVEEVDSFEDGSESLMDNPSSFSGRRFRPRRVRTS